MASADNTFKKMQDFLVMNNLLGKSFATGMDNPQTIEGVKELQAFLKVPSTGVYEDTTAAALTQVLKKDPNAVFKRFNQKKVSSIKQNNLKDKDFVYSIQDMLIKYNIFSAKDRTGIYDQKTFEAIKIMQKLLGLRPTGIYDESLKSEIIKKDKEIPKIIEQQYSDWTLTSQQLDVAALPANDSFLIFDGHHLSWINNGKIIKKWMAVSGKSAYYKKEEKRYYVADEEQENQKKEAGPLPFGRYGIGQVQSIKYKKTNYSIFDFLKYSNRKLFYTEAETHSVIDFKTAQKNVLTRIAWGAFRIPILGRKFGRDKFYIHGGALAGSSGCIDLGDQGMENFAQTMTKTFGTKKHSLFLLVFYAARVEEILKNNQLFSMLLNATTDQQSEELIKVAQELIANKNKLATKKEEKPIKKQRKTSEEPGYFEDIADQYSYITKGYLGKDLSSRFKKLAGI